MFCGLHQHAQQQQQAHEQQHEQPKADSGVAHETPTPAADESKGEWDFEWEQKKSWTNSRTGVLSKFKGVPFARDGSEPPDNPTQEETAAAPPADTSGPILIKLAIPPSLDAHPGSHSSSPEPGEQPQQPQAQQTDQQQQSQEGSTAPSAHITDIDDRPEPRNFPAPPQHTKTQRLQLVVSIPYALLQSEEDRRSVRLVGLAWGEEVKLDILLGELLDVPSSESSRGSSRGSSRESSGELPSACSSPVTPPPAISSLTKPPSSQDISGGPSSSGKLAFPAVSGESMKEGGQLRQKDVLLTIDIPPDSDLVRASTPTPLLLTLLGPAKTTSAASQQQQQQQAAPSPDPLITPTEILDHAFLLVCPAGTSKEIWHQWQQILDVIVWAASSNQSNTRPSSPTQHHTAGSPTQQALAASVLEAPTPPSTPDCDPQMMPSLELLITAFKQQLQPLLRDLSRLLYTQKQLRSTEMGHDFSLPDSPSSLVTEGLASSFAAQAASLLCPSPTASLGDQVAQAFSLKPAEEQPAAEQRQHKHKMLKRMLEHALNTMPLIERVSSYVQRQRTRLPHLTKIVEASASSVEHSLKWASELLHKESGGAPAGVPVQPELTPITSKAVSTSAQAQQGAKEGAVSTVTKAQQGAASAVAKAKKGAKEAASAAASGERAMGRAPKGVLYEIAHDKGLLIKAALHGFPERRLESAFRAFEAKETASFNAKALAIQACGISLMIAQLMQLAAPDQSASLLYGDRPWYTSTLLALVCPIKLVRCSVDGIEASVESRLSELLQKLLCQHNFVPLLTVLPSHRSDTQVAFSSSFFVQLAQKHPSMFCGLAGRLVQGGARPTGAAARAPSLQDPNPLLVSLSHLRVRLIGISLGLQSLWWLLQAFFGRGELVGCSQKTVALTAAVLLLYQGVIDPLTLQVPFLPLFPLLAIGAICAATLLNCCIPFAAAALWGILCFLCTTLCTVTVSAARRHHFLLELAYEKDVKAT